MSNTIILKKSSVGGKVPLATDLQVGELAVNLADARLYSKNAGGTVLNLTPVQSVAGKTGAVTLAKADVGLGNVDNTADASKSVASAAQLTTARTINGVSFNGTANITVADATKLPLTGGTMTGAITFAAGQTWPTFNQSTTGNAATATALQTARTINGVSFNGTANITVADATKLPLTGGTMTGAITFAAGQTWPTFNQNTTGNAATATALQTARTIGGVSFNGTANINLPGVNTTGNQNTTGSAATLTTARTLTIGNTGKTFNGSADVSWTLAEIGAVGAGAGGAIIENTNTISANYTMTSGRNGTSAGPITIASGVVVTIPSGSNWAIV